MAPDSRGRVCTYGLGVTPSRLRGESSGRAIEPRVVAAERRAVEAERRAAAAEERVAELAAVQERITQELAAVQVQLQTTNTRVDRMSAEVQKFSRMFDSITLGLGPLSQYRTGFTNDDPNATYAPDGTQN